MSDDDLDRDQLQKDIHELYAREHRELGDAGTERLLNWGADMSQRWNLPQTLRDGGILVFPHAGVADCGQQIAACVHAALDSGKKKVVVISVLHAFSEAMEQARRHVAAGEPPSNEPFWGIQGPDFSASTRREWTGDHALISWRHFWHAEIKRRGLTDPPEMIERYPYLAGGKPEELPGYAELAAEMEDAAVVSTADPFHHGLGYGDTAENSFYPDFEGLLKAKAVLEEGIEILENADYWGYNQHCVTAKSDA